jgi:hypothetical protein
LLLLRILDRVRAQADQIIKGFYDATGNPAFLLMTEQASFEDRTAIMEHLQTLSFCRKK